MNKQTRSESPSRYRCGYVALAGPPNVGKSTLLNALVGDHLSIVSAKAQTTRERVSGILTTDRYQILFLDSPGLIQPKYALQESMAWTAGAVIAEADVVVYVGDATQRRTLPGGDRVIRLKSPSRPLILAINKSDLVGAGALAGLLQEAGAQGLRAMGVSALTGLGLPDLVASIAGDLPESPALFPPDESATQPVRFFVAEFVRETCMELFRDEVPYSIACRVDEYREDQEPVYVRVIIYVERESQKGIIIGRGGSAIRKVGEISREKVEALLGLRIYLDLRVKVMAGWSRKHRRLRQLGYPVPPEAGGGQKAR